jgi:hypothetical protein
LAATAGAGEQPLDDLMLAMDVVDTLRHEQVLLERELGMEDRDQRMVERLRDIYAAQGIEVSDSILQQGVEALKQDRFSYRPPDPGLSVSLARLYVGRGSWGTPVLAVVGLLLAAGLAWLLLVSGPAKRSAAALPDRFEASASLLQEQAQGPEAVRRVEGLIGEGRTALRRNDDEALEAVIGRMDEVGREIDSRYELRIVNRPGERSGVWRVPDANTSARNYYIVVEAVDDRGEVRSVPVLNEEDGEIHEVKRWGLRVEEALYQAVAADKTDDGIVQNNRFGVKRRGYLVPDYLMATTGAAITRW